MTKLILIGGFLGSGKTTLSAEAAERLTSTGEPVGLITNDQAPELVDTRLLSRIGTGVSEVAGSCFCCNFNGFVDAIRSLIDQGAKTIIAEPVGSCTDLSATILAPIKKYHPEWSLAPLTVLVDPVRFKESLGQCSSRVDADALYIMKLQMEEADRILINKADTLPAEERVRIKELLATVFPGKTTDLISAKTGEGVDRWLENVRMAPDVGATIADVDYDRYAHGEAVLGWLNATVAVRPKNSHVGVSELLNTLMTSLRTELRGIGAEVGHVKAILNIDGRECVANLTRLDGDVDVRRIDSASDNSNSVLILNARAQMAPENLEALVRNLLQKTLSQDLDLEIKAFRCLMPGRPNPTHRFSKTS